MRTAIARVLVLGEGLVGEGIMHRFGEHGVLHREPHTHRRLVHHGQVIAFHEVLVEQLPVRGPGVVLMDDRNVALHAVVRHHRQQRRQGLERVAVRHLDLLGEGLAAIIGAVEVDVEHIDALLVLRVRHDAGIVEGALAQVPAVVALFPGLAAIIAGIDAARGFMFDDGIDAVGIDRRDAHPDLAEQPGQRRSLLAAALFGVIGQGLYQLLWAGAFGTINAGTSALLIAVTPFLTAILASLLRIDPLKPAVAESDKAAAEAEVQVKKQIADLESKNTNLLGQIAELDSARPTHTDGLDEDLLITYGNLFLTKGEAVVALRNEVCSGCHMKVTVSTSASVKARKSIVHCEQCNRILFHEVH